MSSLANAKCVSDFHVLILFISVSPLDCDRKVIHNITMITIISDSVIIGILIDINYSKQSSLSIYIKIKVEK